MDKGNEKIVLLSKKKEELEKLKKELSQARKKEAPTLEGVKTLKLVRNPDKRAGFVDAMVLSFIVIAFAVSTLLLMMVRINMAGL